MARAPEQLPHLELTEEQKAHLTAYLSDELDRSEAERQSYINGLIEEIEAYEALPDEGKTFPWEGAASLSVPMIGSMVDSVFPRLHATIFGASTIVTCEELVGDLAHHAKAWEDALNWILKNELELKNISNSWFLEAVIHGTSVVKLSWERLERETLRYDDAGEVIETRLDVIRNQPVLEHLPLEDFFLPFTAKNIRTAEWVAHRIRTTWGHLKLRESNGLYKNLDNLFGSFEIEEPDYEAARDEMDNTEPLWTEEYEIFEVWLDFDLDGNGVQQPLLVTFHRPTHTLLRVQPNPYNHQRKPFREIVYFPRHDRFYGFGLARQLMPLQDEVTTIHRQRLDNSTIANSRMWKVQAGSRADQSFNGVAPGLKIPVDTMDELDPVPIGDVAQSSFENENVAFRIAQQRSGISDFMMGQDIGTGSGRHTATQVMTMLQESRTRFNWTLEQIREAVEDVSKMVTDLYEQFGVEALERFDDILGEEQSGLLNELFSGIDVEDVRSVSAAMSLQVTASSASVNKAVEQQNLTGLMQMLQQFMTQFEMPMVQIILNPGAPPQLKEYALEKITGIRALLKRMMEINDVRNTAEILGTESPFLLEEEGEQPAGPADEGGEGASTTPPLAAGLEGLPEGALGGMGAAGEPPA